MDRLPSGQDTVRDRCGGLAGTVGAAVLNRSSKVLPVGKAAARRRIEIIEIEERWQPVSSSCDTRLILQSQPMRRQPAGG